MSTTTLPTEAAEIERIRNFIDSLELAEPRGPVLPVREMVLADTKQSASVDAGSLISFVAGLTAQQKSDTLNSTLLAQLAANKKYDREKQTQEWYKFYRNVLENVGWVIQEFSFSKFEAGGSTASVDEVVINVLSAIASGNELAVAISMVQAMKKLPTSDGRAVLWEQESHNASQGNFQIGTAVDSSGVVVMKLGAFHFTTKEEVTRVLWFKWSGSQSQMYKATQSINLNNDVYSRVRQQVIDKLGDRATQFVADLDI